PGGADPGQRGPRPGPALRVPGILDKELRQDGLQDPLSAPGTADRRALGTERFRTLDGHLPAFARDCRRARDILFLPWLIIAERRPLFTKSPGADEKYGKRRPY